MKNVDKTRIFQLKFRLICISTKSQWSDGRLNFICFFLFRLKFLFINKEQLKPLVVYLQAFKISYSTFLQQYSGWLPYEYIDAYATRKRGSFISSGSRPFKEEMFLNYSNAFFS